MPLIVLRMKKTKPDALCSVPQFLFARFLVIGERAYIFTGTQEGTVAKHHRQHTIVAGLISGDSSMITVRDLEP